MNDINSARDLSQEELRSMLNQIEEQTDKEQAIRDYNSKLRESVIEEKDIVSPIETLFDKPPIADVPKPEPVLGVKNNYMPKPGYKPIPLEYLPSKGLFYPLGSQISIRPASVKEVRHFSSIEESDLVDIDEKLMYILQNCVDCDFGPLGKNVGHLSVIDYYYLIFSIRDMTFTEGENTLSVDAECEICGVENKNIPITRGNLISFVEDPLFMDNYDEVGRCFKFTHETLGENSFVFPSIGTLSWLKKFFRRNSNNDNFDKDFVEFSPYLIKNFEGLTDETFNLLNDITMTWDIKLISLYLELIQRYKKISELNLKYKCKDCGHEVTTFIYFQEGYKSLFTYTNILSGLVQKENDR